MGTASTPAPAREPVPWVTLHWKCDRCQIEHDITVPATYDSRRIVEIGLAQHARITTDCRVGMLRWTEFHAPR